MLHPEFMPIYLVYIMKKIADAFLKPISLKY